MWASAGLRGACSGRTKLRELALFHAMDFRDAEPPPGRGKKPQCFRHFAFRSAAALVAPSFQLSNPLLCGNHVLTAAAATSSPSETAAGGASPQRQYSTRASPSGLFVRVVTATVLRVCIVHQEANSRLHCSVQLCSRTHIVGASSSSFHHMTRARLMLIVPLFNSQLATDALVFSRQPHCKGGACI